jgi:hypothetical protein
VREFGSMDQVGRGEVITGAVIVVVASPRGGEVITGAVVVVVVSLEVGQVITGPVIVVVASPGGGEVITGSVLESTRRDSSSSTAQRTRLGQGRGARRERDLPKRSNRRIFWLLNETTMVPAPPSSFPAKGPGWLAYVRGGRQLRPGALTVAVAFLVRRGWGITHGKGELAAKGRAGLRRPAWGSKQL